MGNVLNKVKSGDLLAIPAGRFNTFVDAARGHLDRTHSQGPFRAGWAM